MQCKDIPDRPILEYLANAGQWVMRWRNPDPEWKCVLDAMPPGVPDKLVLAKMQKLIDRGLVDGCTCGCRGDFELTEKGRDVVEGINNTARNKQQPVSETRLSL